MKRYFKNDADETIWAIITPLILYYVHCTCMVECKIECNSIRFYANEENNDTWICLPYSRYF